MFAGVCVSSYVAGVYAQDMVFVLLYELGWLYFVRASFFSHSGVSTGLAVRLGC